MVGKFFKIRQILLRPLSLKNIFPSMFFSYLSIPVLLHKGIYLLLIASFITCIVKKNLRISPLLWFSVASFLVILLAGMSTGTTNGPIKWTTLKADSSGIILVKNANGPTLGYSSASGVKILTVDGLAFKDLNKNGKLDKYEDWRLPVDERAKDLASKMSVEQIAGLMLYSAHQAIPASSRGPLGAGTYNGKKVWRWRRKRFGHNRSAAEIF